MELSILAIIISAVLLMALGMLWYSPILFGKPWMKAMGMTKEDCKDKKGMGKFMFWEAIVTITFVVLFNFLLMYTTAPIICVALFIWGFVLLTMISTNIWEKKPWTLIVLGASFRLVALIIIALVFMSPLGLS